MTEQIRFLINWLLNERQTWKNDQVSIDWHWPDKVDIGLNKALEMSTKSEFEMGVTSDS